MPREALGLIETRGMIGAIEVTRAATKAAELVIISAEQSNLGRVTVKIEGSWAAVLSAVEAGARAAEQAGQLVSMHLIGNPDANLSAILPYQLFINRYQPNDALVIPRKPGTIKVTKPSRTPTARKPAASKPSAQKAAVAKPAAAKPTPTKPVPPPEPVPTPAQPQAPVSIPSMAELEAMPVVKLRQFARTIPNFPIQGRQISMANKTQLLEAIRLLQE